MKTEFIDQSSIEERLGEEAAKAIADIVADYLNDIGYRVDGFNYQLLADFEVRT